MLLMNQWPVTFAKNLQMQVGNLKPVFDHLIYKKKMWSYIRPIIEISSTYTIE